MARFEKQFSEQGKYQTGDSSEIMWGFLSVISPLFGDFALWMPKSLMVGLAASLQCCSPEEIDDKMVSGQLR